MPKVTAYEDSLGHLHKHKEAADLSDLSRKIDNMLTRMNVSSAFLKIIGNDDEFTDSVDDYIKLSRRFEKVVGKK